MIGCLVILLNFRLGRHRRRKEDNIEMDREQIGCTWSRFIELMIQISGVALVNIKFWEFFEWLSSYVLLKKDLAPWS
jgi:hypothetical protein